MAYDINLGPKSRARLIAYPVSQPKQAPSPKMRKNKQRGNHLSLLGTPLLLGSFNAKITNISNADAINSEKNWLAFVTKGCGYVQKIPAVAFVAGGTVLIPDPPSNQLIADM